MHILHSDPSLGFQEYLKENKTVLANLDSCFECLLSYLQVSVESKHKLELDVSRLSKSINLILDSEILNYKNKILLILFEILSNPSPILQLSGLVFKFITIISQKLPALKLADKILPGLLILRTCKDALVSKWALDILKKKSKVFMKILQGQESEWDRFIDLSALLDLLGDLTEQMDQQVVQRLLKDFPDFLNIVKGHFHAKFTNFYQYLRIYINLNIQGRLGNDEKFKEIIKVIDSTCKMDSSLSSRKILLDWIPVWLMAFPDQINNLGILRALSFNWTSTIQDYLNSLLSDLFRENFSDSSAFCIYFLQDSKVYPSILQAVETCFLKKAGELKVIVNSLSRQEMKKDDFHQMAKESTSIFLQVSNDHVNRAYKVLAIKSFSEICYLSMIKTTEELESLINHVQSLVLNMVREISRSERSFRSAFVRTLQTRILFLLFLDSNGLYEELVKIITGSTDYADLNEFLEHLWKKDPNALMDTTEHFFSVFIGISDNMRVNVKVMGRIVIAIPILFSPVFKSTSSILDEKISAFKTLFQNAVLQILRISHKWLKEIQQYPKDFKDLVIRQFTLLKSYFSFMKSDRNQMFYLNCLLIKWLLVNDEETRKACLNASILYMGSSLLQKDDLVKLSKTLENILPTSGVSDDFSSSYRSFFVKTGIPFMKKDQNSDPDVIVVSQKAAKVEYIPNIPKVVKSTRNWGGLDTWTELATSSLKRKENTFQNNRNSKKVVPANISKGLSKLDQIKAEIRSTNSSTRLEARRAAESSAPYVKSGPKLGPDRSPVKEKRSTKILDITSLNPVSSTVNVSNSQKKPVKVHEIDQFYRQILSWDITNTTRAAPPGIDTLVSPKNSYTDNQAYFKAFYPLFLTELWGQINAAWAEQRSNRAIEIETQHVSHIGDFIDVTFSVESNAVYELELSENDLMMIWKGSGNDAHPGALARIKSITMRSHDSKNMTLNVFIPGFSFIRNNFWSAKKVTSLTPSLREYEALIRIGDYSLGYQILNPSKIQIPQVDISKTSKIMSSFKVNSPQAEAIIAATSQHRGFIMIQGPPGTGKTKTILGIIGASIKKSRAIITPGISIETLPTNNNRILCCAPSNAAVDEISRRLISGIFDIYGKKFFPNIIRFGKAAVHPSVQSVTLESLMEKELKESSAISTTESNILKIEEKKNGISREISALHDDRDAIRLRMSKDPTACSDDLENEVRELNKKLTSLHKSLDEIKNTKERGNAAIEKARRELRARLVSSADIILCTLSGSGHEMFTEIRDLTFETVIIDEACQSIEISSLIPLQYKAKKCILVGDPNQLPPTVISQEAQRYLYNQSLFQRIMNINKKAVHLLNLQYRMHPEISQFPSEYFYDSQLYNGPNIEASCSASWHKIKTFGAYKFYDIAFGREQKTSRNSVLNIEEAIVCAKLVKLLCLSDEGTNFQNKIGIISFYRDQIRPIRAQLNKFLNRDLADSIDVMTVDGFQGQEKDIIILSCVRAGGGLGFITDTRRMNVALTRAKKTMIVLGNSHTLSNSKDWEALIENAKRRNRFEKLTESWLNQELRRAEKR